MKRFMVGLLYSFACATNGISALDGAIPQVRVGTPNPVPYHITYDDNTQSPDLIVRVRRDLTPPLVYEETVDGYTVTFDNDTTYYYYADVNDVTGELYTTTFLARKDDNSHVGYVMKNAARRIQEISRISKQGRSETLNTNATSIEHPSRSQGAGEVITSGTFKNLVVLLKFSDHVDRPLPSRSDIDTLMNSDTADELICPTGSVKDFFLKNSFGKYNYDSTVLDWVTISKTETYCADNASGLSRVILECLEEALDLIKNDINFDDFDANNDSFIDGITYLHSGYAAEHGRVDSNGKDVNDRIWSHQWSFINNGSITSSVRTGKYSISPALWGVQGTLISRVGVLVHEAGHFLGLPDLYDEGDEDFGQGNGLGSYCLMANLWGFTGDQLNPPHVSAYKNYTKG